MIACYSKDISLVKSNQWTHLFHPDVYWFAWYKNEEGKPLELTSMDNIGSILAGLRHWFIAL